MNVGEREETVLGGDGEIGGHQQAHAEAGAGAMHRGDHRLSQAAQAQDDGMHAVDETLEARAPLGRRQARELGEELDVAAGQEAVAGASHDDDAQRRIGFDAVEGVRETVDHVTVEGVQDLGPIERERRDGTLAGQEHGVVHGGLSHRDRRCRSISGPKRRLLDAVAQNASASSSISGFAPVAMLAKSALVSGSTRAM